MNLFFSLSSKTVTTDKILLKPKEALTLSTVELSLTHKIVAMGDKFHPAMLQDPQFLNSTFVEDEELEEDEEEHYSFVE